MSTRIIEEIIDDLDGTSDDVETVPFAFRGTAYEIDLGPENRAEFDRLMATYVDAARVIERPKTSKRPTAQGDPENAKIRAWARSQGLEIGDRGRIPEPYRVAYYAGHARP